MSALSRALAAALCPALALLAAAGCRSDDKPKTYPVRGKIVYKGAGEPAHLAGGTVMLEPVADPKAAQVRGDINDDGTFAVGSIIDSKSVSGALAGEYRVRIELPEGGRRAARARIDPRFLKYDTSGLSLTVATGKNDVTLEVEGPR